MNWRRFFQRKRRDEEFAHEVDSYVAHEIDDNLARGMGRLEAERAARRKFGNATSVQEEVHHMNTVRSIDSIWQNLRYGLRQLLRSPGFTVAAVLSLALGIGANTAIYQLLDAVRLRSLPVRNPQELAEVKLAGGDEKLGTHAMWTSEMTYALWEQVRERQQAFSGVFAWGSESIPFGEGTQEREVAALWLSGETFGVLGIAPYRGRLFQPADDRRGCGDATAVVSYGFWQSEYGGKEGVVGSRLILAGRPFTIIGVTPRGFYGLEVGKQFDVALPTCAHEPWGRFLSRREVFWLVVMGRLKPGWTVERAATQLQAIGPGVLEAAAPTGYDASSMQRWFQFRVTAEPAGNGISRLRNDYERSLWLLLGVTGMVLSIACANLANLLLARASARRREFAVRHALGASRGRLIAQVLSESLLLAAAGALAGVALARLLSGALVWFLSTQSEPFTLDLGLDWRILAFAGGVAVTTCLLFGLAPALRAARTATAEAVKAGERSSTADRRRFSFQRALIVAQIGISLVLVVGALLFVRSFHNLITLDAGFQQDGILFAKLDFGRLRPAADRVDPQKRELLEMLRAIPGVEAASTTTHIPLVGMSWMLGLRAPGHEGQDRDWSQFTWVDPEYFRTMRIAILKGRAFGGQDTKASPKVVLVNETFVRKIFGGEDPIGQVVQSLAEPGYPAATYEVVGVVADTKYADLREELPQIAYAPETQNPAFGPSMRTVVRTSLPPAQTIGAIRKGVAAISPDIRMRFQVLRTIVNERLVRERALGWLSGFFGVLAAVTAMLGLYGVISYMVTRRRHEIGIRIALGASRPGVVWLILRQVTVLYALGACIGVAAALIAGGGARTLLFGLGPNDPLTFGAAVAGLGFISLLASLLPAWRAVRVDPMKALREE